MKERVGMVLLAVTAVVIFSFSVLEGQQTMQPAQTTPQKLQQTPQKLGPVQPLTVEVTSASTRSVRLEPGGRETTVTLRGNNLNRVTDCRVLLNNQPTRDLEVRLGPPAAKVRRITLRAAATATPGGSYRLQLLADKEVIEVPISLEVAAPKVTKLHPKKPKTTGPQPTPPPPPEDDRPELDREPAHPVGGTTVVGEIERVETPIQAQIFYDFQITDVYYREGHDRVIIYFTSGRKVYQGSLACDVQVGGGSVQRLNTSQAATMYFILPLEWPDDTCSLNISVTLNPDHEVFETDYDNNLYEGKIFKWLWGNFKIARTGNPPRKRIGFLWGHDWACGSNRNLLESEVRDDPGYDEYDHFLYASAAVWVENCSATAGEALVEFLYIGYDRERRDQIRVRLEPGERKKVQTGVPLKIRKKGNYLLVLVSPSSPYREECRIDLKFNGFPWF